jgi:two-component system CheB/CheR fusion protein
MGEVCRLVSESAASHRVKVICREPVFPQAILSLDPNQIKEVILNLVLNAIEAMPEGGSVELSVTIEGETLKVHVKDEGEGVPEGDLQQIFDPFYTTKPTGTGLGLPIAYQI